MKDFLAYIYPILKSTVEVSASITKFSLGVGILLITLHFMHINYFPTDLSIGDGLVFILVTCKLFILICFFVASHYSLGKFIQKTFSLLKTIGYIFKYPKRMSKILCRNVKLKYKFLMNRPERIIIYIFGFLSMIMLFSFYDGMFSNGIKESVINLGVMFFCVYFIVISVDSAFDNFKSRALAGNDKHSKVFIKILFAVVLIPIVYSFSYQTKQENKFISFSSSLVREQNNQKIIVYVKKSYKDFFPEKSITDAKGDYIPLQNVEVVLRGIGKNALLQYHVKQLNHKDEIQKIEIPNDALLIVRRD